MFPSVYPYLSHVTPVFLQVYCISLKTGIFIIIILAAEQYHCGVAAKCRLVNQFVDFFPQLSVS